jgi:hypothetical protein
MENAIVNESREGERQERERGGFEFWLSLVCINLFLLLDNI